MDHKLSLNVLIFALVMGAVVCFAAFVLYGAWSNDSEGRRQKLRKQGVHPTTDGKGGVHAREREDDGE